MICRFSMLHALLLAMFTLFAVQVVKAEEVNAADKSQYFHINGKSPWVEIPQAALAEHSNQVKALTGKTEEYLAGYTLAPQNNQFELPFILVMRDERGRYPEAELAKITRYDIPSDLHKRLKELGAGSPTIMYEEARRIVWLEVVAGQPEQEQKNVITAMKLIETGVINFTLYCSSAEKEIRLREFNDFLNLVSINPRIEYRSRKPVEQLDSTNRVGRGFIKATVMSVIMLCIILIFRAIRRIKTRLGDKKGKLPDSTVCQQPKEKQTFRNKEEYEAWKAQKMATRTAAQEKDKHIASKLTITTKPIITESSISVKDNFMNKLEKKLMGNQEKPSIIHTKSPLFWIGIIVIILFAITVYPTMYRYDHMKKWEGEDYLIRVNRITGNADVLVAEGWRRLKPPSE